MKKDFKISQFSRYFSRSPTMRLKLLNSVPFIKKTLVNHVYIRIWSSWLTLPVFQWMKAIFKICKFSRFLLRSEYIIQVKIWKWLNLLNSFPFIKKTLVNHVYIRISSFWLTFTALQGMKTKFKITQFEEFSCGPGIRFWSKS